MAALSRYFVRRVAQAIPLLFVILAITFALVHLAPGDPVTIFAGESGDAAYYAEMRRKFALDRPLLEQFWTYLTSLLRGDFGFSYAHRQPALDVVAGRIPATLLLTGSALVLSTAAGVILAIVGARNDRRLADHAITALVLLAGALPAFWLGQMLVLAFAVRLGWLPVQGMSSLRPAGSALGGALDLGAHLVLPVATLTLLQLPLVARLARTGLREAMSDDYIRTAAAKGLSSGAIVRAHALPNALLPVVTAVGSHVGTLLTGAVLTEIIFAWPGIGRLLYDATFARDYPVLLAIFLITTFAVIVANLCTDLAYAWFDPRVRLR